MWEILVGRADCRNEFSNTLLETRNNTKNQKTERKFNMWIADGWKDYEILDTSNGEKLERWGDYILVRPDPQVIWDTPKKNAGWRKMNGHYHSSMESLRLT